MASEAMRRRTGITVEDFERAIDEFFDEMLIAPWRRSGAGKGEFDRTRASEYHDRYEFKIALPGIDPHRIEVELVGQRLLIRASGGPEGRFETSYSFLLPIDSERVTASWSKDSLLVVLPKRKPHRVRINHQ